MKFKVEILSPVMIWSGFDADTIFDIHQFEGYFKVVDKRKLLENLSINELKEIITDPTFPNPSLIKKWKQKDIYKPLTIPYKGTINSRQIRTLIKTKEGYPYIPGSSLKGAIVSSYFRAILYEEGKLTFPIIKSLSTSRAIEGRDGLLVRDSAPFEQSWAIGISKRVYDDPRKPFSIDKETTTEYLPPQAVTRVEITHNSHITSIPSYKRIKENSILAELEKRLQSAPNEEAILEKVDHYTRHMLEEAKKRMEKTLLLIREDSLQRDYKKILKEVENILGAPSYLLFLGAHKTQPPPKERTGRRSKTILHVINNQPVGIAHLVPLDNENQD